MQEVLALIATSAAAPLSAQLALGLLDSLCAHARPDGAGLALARRLLPIARAHAGRAHAEHLRRTLLAHAARAGGDEDAEGGSDAADGAGLAADGAPASSSWRLALTTSAGA